MATEELTMVHIHGSMWGLREYLRAERASSYLLCYPLEVSYFFLLSHVSLLLTILAKLLEAWELAPFPQFRLIGDLHDSKRNPTVSNSRLVCSLRTIVPPTKPLPEDPDEDELASPKYNFQFSMGPTEMAIQRNVTATRSTKEHIIVWSDKDDISNPESAEAVALEKLGRGRATGSGEFVRNLKIGDVVTVWGKSRFAGWTNTVEEVQIDVYWSV